MAKGKGIFKIICVVLSVILVLSFIAYLPLIKQVDAASAKKGLRKLTQQDVLSIFKPGVYGIYKDKTMKVAVKAVGPEAVQLTEAEKQKLEK